MVILNLHLAVKSSTQQQINIKCQSQPTNTIDLASSKSIPKYSWHSPSVFASPISTSGSRRNFANFDYNYFQPALIN